MKPHDLQELIKLYESGLTLRQIATLINRTHVAVYYRLRKVIKLRPRFNTRAGEEWLKRCQNAMLDAPNLPGVCRPLRGIYRSDCPKCMNKLSVYAYGPKGSCTWSCNVCDAKGTA